MKSINDRSIDIGEYIPAPDDDMLICRCEEITKGEIRQSGRDPRELPLAMYGIQKLWPTLSEELEVDCEYHQDGNLRLGKTPQHIKILTGLADRARACGLDVRMIDGDEVRAINPYLSDEVTGASWCPTDGHANPRNRRHRCADAVCRAGESGHRSSGPYV